MDATSSKFHDFDVLILGSGAAGLTTALHLDNSFNIAVISKGKLSSGSTAYAQGGISAVLDDSDSIEQHISDTLLAGGGLGDPQVVAKTVAEGKKVIEWLLSIGVDFTRDSGANSDQLHLTREGGHSRRRVVHVADATGNAVQNQLIEEVRSRKNIQALSNYIAIDLITAHKLGRSKNRCVGAYILNCETGHVEVFRAKFVILATGGASKVYLLHQQSRWRLRRWISHGLAGRLSRRQYGIHAIPSQLVYTTQTPSHTSSVKPCVAKAVKSYCRMAPNFYTNLTHVVCWHHVILLPAQSTI